MVEVKYKDVSDTQGKKPEGYKEIKPQGDTNINATRSFWDKTFEEKSDIVEKPKEGGSYAEVKKYSDGETHEVHHMPADSASSLERNDGPAIRMEKADHRQTANCGSSKEAREYQAAQKELIENGKFREALQMDIDDIRGKFGSKYDTAISEMLSYVDKLESEGQI